METFKIKALAEWIEVAPQEQLSFPRGLAGRTIRVDFNTTGPVEVYAALSADMSGETLLAAASGMFAVEWSVEGVEAVDADVTPYDVWPAAYLQVRAVSGARVFVKTWTPDHTVEKQSFEVYTNIEMRRQRNPEVDRIMMMMRLNAQSREAQMAEEVADLRKQIDALRAEEEANVGEVVEPAGSGGGGVVKPEA